MKAVVRYDDDRLPGLLKPGDPVEVVGFVIDGGVLMAVLLDHGYLSTIPAWVIQVQEEVPA